MKRAGRRAGAAREAAPRGSGRARTLVIVESPTKARTIERFLGSGYKVMASMGHVRDLLKSRLSLDPDKGFEPTYRVLKDKREIVKALQKEARRADAVYLAPDPDREGEAIAWHLVEALGIPPEKARRVTFHEITARAVEEAFRHAGAIDMDKVNAQQARRILDRLVGYKLSPLLWKRVASGLSAGRVQSVAVRLIVEREKEIEAFTPEVYWRVTARLRREGDGPADAFEALLVAIDGEAVRTGADPAPRTLDAAEAARAAAAAREARFTVLSVDTREKHLQPPPPFTTSLLQQAAANALGFSAKRTMAIAQQLYQGIDLGPEGPVGLITYMRTDAVRFADEALADCRAQIAHRFGRAYLPESPRRFKSRKAAQEAHEAIRPTAFARFPESVQKHLTPEQYKLYRLIWTRAVASQMAAARVAVTQATVQAGGCRFAASGRVVLFDGYMRVLPRAGEEPRLPPLKAGEALHVEEIRPSRHETQPPPRFSEATLVKALEALGIGRPSTYAPIVSTIQERGYVVKEDKRLKPTPMGRLVTEELVSHFPEILDVGFTSRMEEELDGIEEAQIDWRRVLDDFYGPFSKALAAAAEGMTDVKGTVETVEEACPRCGRPLVVKWSRFGKFLGCSGFAEKDPDKKCAYRRPFEPEAAVETGLSCDLCGSPMIEARGRFGPYLRCARYPEACDFTMKIDKKGHPVRKFVPLPTDRACESCGQPLVVRVTARGKRGPRPFLSCSGFPRCRFGGDLPEDLAGLGAQALARWQANAVKNKADLLKYQTARLKPDGSDAAPEEGGAVEGTRDAQGEVGDGESEEP